MKLKTGEVWAVLVKRTYFPTAQSCVSGHSHCQHSYQMLDVKPLWDECLVDTLSTSCETIVGRVFGGHTEYQLRNHCGTSVWWTH